MQPLFKWKILKKLTMLQIELKGQRRENEFMHQSVLPAKRYIEPMLNPSTPCPPPSFFCRSDSSILAAATATARRGYRGCRRRCHPRSRHCRCRCWCRRCRPSSPLTSIGGGGSRQTARLLCFALVSPTRSLAK